MKMRLLMLGLSNSSFVWYDISQKNYKLSLIYFSLIYSVAKIQ